MRRYVLTLVIAFLAVTAAAIWYAYQTTPEYEAATLLLIQSQPLSKLENNDALSIGYLDGPGIGTRDLSNQVLILENSLLIAERTVKQLRELRTVPESGEPLSLLAQGRDSLSDTDLALLLQGSYVKIRPGFGRTDAIWVTGVSSQAGEAALVANLYAQEYVRRSQELSQQRITGSRAFLEAQLAKQREELQRLETEIRQYQSTQRALALDDETRYLVAQVSQMQAALDDARIQASMGEASLRSLEQELRTIQPRLTERVASSVEKEMEQTQTKIAELELVVEQTYARTPALRENPGRNAELVRLLDQIAQLRSRMTTLSEQYMAQSLGIGGLSTKEEGMTYVAQLKQRILAERITLGGAQAKVGAIEQRIREYEAKLRTIPSQTLRLAQLERSHQTAEQLYLQLVEKLQAVSLAEESDNGFAQILRPALTPGAPVRPNRPKTIIMGILTGLLLGCLLAIAQSWVDTRLHTPDDLAEIDAPMSGTIPDLTRTIRQAFRGKETIEIDGRRIHTAMVAVLAPLTPAAEAFRHQYLSLQFSRMDRVVQTILVTSPEARVGKSTTAMNLAVTTAMAGRKTLVLDVDLHRPSLHGLLGSTSRLTIDTLVQQPHAFNIEDLATGIDNLYALTTPEPLESPSSLLRSRAWRDLLDRFKGSFDIIIIDTHPVLATSDAILLSAQCDVALVVALAGSTTSEAMRHALKEIRKVGVAEVQTVLNRFDAARTFGYKKTYGYRDQYYRTIHPATVEESRAMS